MQMTVSCKKLDPRAKLPVYATPGAAAADLCALVDEPLTAHAAYTGPHRPGH